MLDWVFSNCGKFKQIKGFDQSSLTILATAVMKEQNLWAEPG